MVPLSLSNLQPVDPGRGSEHFERLLSRRERTMAAPGLCWCFQKLTAPFWESKEWGSECVRFHFFGLPIDGNIHPELPERLFEEHFSNQMSIPNPNGGLQSSMEGCWELRMVYTLHLFGTWKGRASAQAAGCGRNVSITASGLDARGPQPVSHGIQPKSGDFRASLGSLLKPTKGPKFQLN